MVPDEAGAVAAGQVVRADRPESVRDSLLPEGDSG
jgi:hypothetical protein